MVFDSTFELCNTRCGQPQRNGRPFETWEYVVIGAGATAIVAGVVWLVAEVIVHHGDSPRMKALKQALAALPPPEHHD